MVGSPTEAQARTPYDGRWSVLIVTQRGECDRAYRYPLLVQNGIVYNGGDTTFDISGRVAGNGAVRVTISAGGQSASGSGRLARNFGRGTWATGRSSTRCSGYWEAERR